MKIVLASNNAGKIREFNTLLQDQKIEVIPQSELKINEIEETGLTFIENAILKARHASRLTGMPALADDSGLVVDFLKDEPGIYSARYAGKNADAKQNIQKLLTTLENVPEKKREAYFYCVLVYLEHAEDPAPLVCEGKWNGFIATKPTGTEGFGYDPIFYVPDEKKTAAELSAVIKNKISHRGKALELLLKKLPEKLCTHLP